MALALKIVREGGADALEEEIRVRGVTGISVKFVRTFKKKRVLKLNFGICLFRTHWDKENEK